jgi:hypothetical protein
MKAGELSSRLYTITLNAARMTIYINWMSTASSGTLGMTQTRNVSATDVLVALFPVASL